jgi:hypothetical protein
MIRDQDLEFFKPKIRRYLTVGISGGWAILEWFVFGSTFWGILASAMSLYSYWRLFLTYPEE